MEKMCISCLKSSRDNYYSILTIFPEFSRRSLSVLDLLAIVTNSQIEITENAPSKICLECLKSLKVAYSFIVSFNYSQKILEKYLKQYEHSNFVLQENEDLEEKMEEYQEKILIITEDDNDDSDEFNKEEHNKIDKATEDFSENIINHVDNIKLEEIDEDSHNMQENVDMDSEVTLVFDEDIDQPIDGIEDNILEDITPKNSYQKFSCEFCAESYDANMNLLAHIRAKHPDNWLSYQRNLEQSTTEKEKNIVIYKCQSCKMAFSSKSSLQIHIRRMHNNTIKRKRNNTIKRRQNITEGNNKCKVCNEVLKSISSERYHRFMKHRDKKYACDMCDQKFALRCGLNQHITGVHEKSHPEKFLCSECGRGFKYSTALKYHIGKVHTNQRDYVCAQCGLSFVLIGELRGHQRTHSMKRPYKCKYCEKSFKRSSPKNRHEDTHLGIFPHECEFCNEKKFITSNNMKLHWLSHRGNFTCEVCGKGFAAAKILDFHYSRKHKMKNVVIKNE